MAVSIDEIFKKTIEATEKIIYEKLENYFPKELLEFEECYISGSFLAFYIGENWRKFNNVYEPIIACFGNKDMFIVYDDFFNKQWWIEHPDRIFGENSVYDFPKDIDIYVKNPLEFLNKFNRLLYKKTDIITTTFDNPKNIIENFDSTLVQCYYYGKEKKLTWTKEFEHDLKNGYFRFCSKPSLKRYDKLLYRAKHWFNCEHQTFLLTKSLEPSVEYTFYPSQVTCRYGVQRYETFWGKIPCISKCGNTLNKLTRYSPKHTFICDDCKVMCGNIFNSTSFNMSGKNVLIIGGRRGFGECLANIVSKYGPRSLVVTSRTASNANTCNPDYKILEYDVTNDYVPHKVRTIMKFADIIIFNAWVPNDKEKFNSGNAVINIGVINDNIKFVNGFIRFLYTLKDIRRYYKKRTTFIWLDSDESKYENKFKNGKHIGSNCLKSCGKQVLWTNSEKFGTYGINIIMFDPGYLGYKTSIMSKEEEFYYNELQTIVAKTLLWMVATQCTNESLYYINRTYDDSKPLYPQLCYEVSFYAAMKHFLQCKKPSIKDILEKEIHPLTVIRFNIGNWKSRWEVLPVTNVSITRKKSYSHILHFIANIFYRGFRYVLHTGI